MYNLTSFLKGAGLLLANPAPVVETETVSTLKSSYVNTFSIADFTMNVTLKGSHKLRHLKGKFKEQYVFISNIINTIIDSFAKYYYFVCELNTDGEWIHVHGTIKMIHRSKIDKLKNLIWSEIEGKQKPPRAFFKPRLDSSKIHSTSNWYEYIMKEQDTVEPTHVCEKYLLHKYKLGKNL